MLDVPPTAEGHWTCNACGRTDRWLRRVRCECGSFAPVSSIKKALAARKPKENASSKPPWSKGGREERPPKKPPTQGAGAEVVPADPPEKNLTDKDR